MSSILYTMGVLTLAALIVAVISGAVIALGGVSIWHTNSFGAFMNSIHFWSVQAMFLFMAVHFITSAGGGEDLDVAAGRDLGLID